MDKKHVFQLNQIIVSIAEKHSIRLVTYMGSNQEELKHDIDLINDMGFDSIMLMSMVVELETAMNIQFPDEKLTMDVLRSYDLLVDTINMLLNKKE